MDRPKHSARKLWCLAILLIVSGCQDMSQSYAIVHRDGRVWIVNGEPYIGGDHGLSGWGLNAAQFRNASGHHCAVKLRNVRIMTEAEFDEIYDPSKHELTTEYVWEAR